MRTLKNLFLVLLLVLTVVVVLQNTETVETRFLFYTLSMPRALLLSLALAAGIVVGLLAGARLRAKGDKAQAPG